MWVRVLFTLAVLTAVLWVQIDHHGVVAGELLLGVGIVALVNLPMYIVERRLPTRSAAAIIVVVRPRAGHGRPSSSPAAR